MHIVVALALLLTSAVACWQNRPATKGNEWPGSAAGRFAAALMLLGLAVVELLALVIDDVSQTQLLMTQLGLYAALPLMLSSQLAERLGQHWTRQTWGRIFPGWCVVFELGRRADVLDTVAIVTLVAGAVTLLLCWAPATLLPGNTASSEAAEQSSAVNSYLPLLLWAAAAAAHIYWQGPEPVMLPLALLALILAQPESYRMARR